MTIFVDFEYNDRAVILGCFFDDVTGIRHTFDFRNPTESVRFANFIEGNRDQTFAAYAAMAEMDSFLRLGVTVQGMDWIDLRAESNMISGTHSVWRAYHAGLHDHLAVFDIPVPAVSKRDMRELIITRDAWSDAEWAEIVAYCWSDVDCLPELFRTIRDIHEAIPTVWNPEHALTRGDYLKACATLDHRSKGLPVDEPMLRSLFANKRAIQNALAEECNAHYGHPFYARKLDTIEKLEDGARRVNVRYTLSHEGLEGYLKTLPWVRWERTPSGRLSLDDSYLDDLIKDQPSLTTFRYTRQMLAQLNNDGLVEQLTPDSYIKPLSLPFYTVTGRNQPMAARGFLLNLPPWLRHVIRPHPGQVLIACDWSKQEIGIAAALSGDEALITAFRSADIYLELAKMAGAVPPEGTKDTHETERQAYKSVQLGLGYGMGRRGLAKQLYADLNMGKTTPIISKKGAEDKANEIYDWHKATFPVYWDYLRSQADGAKAKGYTTTKDAWFYFADSDTPTTRLMNFPMQGNGAVMLREAMKILAFQTDLDVVCSLHDAIYIQCQEDQAEAATKILKDAMRRAVRIVIGDDIQIAVDAKVYTHAEGYIDKRGTKTLQTIKYLLAALQSNPVPLTEVVPKKVRKPKPRIAGDIFILGNSR